MTGDRHLLGIFTLFCGTFIFSTNIQSCYGYFFGPEFQICDSTRLRRFRRNICASKLVFTSNTTKINSDCICVSGIWLIINRDCIPSILVSYDGCVVSYEIKALEYLGALGRDDFFTVVPHSDFGLTFDILRPVQNANVTGNIWIYNGLLLKANDGRYCAQKWQSNSSSEIEVSKTNKIARYTIYGKLTVQYECSPSYTKIKLQNKLYQSRNRETSECIIDCSKRTLSKLIIQRQPEATAGNSSSTHHSLKRNLHLMKKRDQLPPVSYESDVSRKENQSKIVSPDVQTQINHLHRRLLTKILAYGIDEQLFTIDANTHHDIPELSFTLLDKLQDITFKTCAGKVSKKFLDFAFMMFLVAYENRGTFLLEYLTEKEETDILQFLDDCYDSLTPLQFNEGDLFCPHEVIKSVQMDGEIVSVNLTRNITDFYLHDRHLTIDLPWSMLDITLGVCIDAFSQSYLYYHKMEQAIEKLFIEELKTLWQYPPENGKLYTRLYGPNWEYFTENLERCAISVYIHNPKLARLKRPGESGFKTSKSSSEVGQDIPPWISPPMEIPPITRETRQAGLSQQKSNSILKSVSLMCRPMNWPQCYFE